MVVDVPANAPCTPVADTSAGPSSAHRPARRQPCTPCGPRPPRPSIPDDPSNVYHSYLSDHTRFRVAPRRHQGAPHPPPARPPVALLARQRQVDLPGQPGDRPRRVASPSEIAYDGSGNRNQTVGDSIFHCHFYPHFAQGMWALWRVHDVFERGTRLDANGRPAAGSPGPAATARSLAGTPIPAIVPLPGKPMAPMPGAAVADRQRPGGACPRRRPRNPGYPFFVPGVAGHRPPHPPMDSPSTDDGLRSTAACRATVVLSAARSASRDTRLRLPQDDHLGERPSGCPRTARRSSRRR